jgi:hypothetical protein
MAGMKTFLFWLFGALIGYGCFSGWTANLFNVPQGWIFNPELGDGMYQVNLWTMTFLMGLVPLGTIYLLTPTPQPVPVETSSDAPPYDQKN